MKQNIIDSVLQVMRPGCFYRSTDIVSEINISSSAACKALKELNRGQIIEMEQDKKRRIYITKQRALF